MSIITDALKKAEQERDLKAKHAAKMAKVAFIEPERAQSVEVLLEQSHMVETQIEQSIRPAGMSQPDTFKGPWFSSPQFREVSIISTVVGVIISCLVILLALPHWPGMGKDSSIIWRPFRVVGLFQVPPMYQQNIFLERLQHSGSENGVKLPFILTGISAQGNKSYAIVNGVVVQKGDLIDGATVKEILDRGVVLETRAGEIKLKIQP